MDTKFKKGMKTWNKGLKGVQAAWNKGIPLSEESKLKLRGRKLSDEHKRKIKKSKQNMSLETRKKMSISALKNRGKTSERMKNRILSQETKSKISLANKGKKRTIEQKLMLSLLRKGRTAWNKGKHHTKETKEKLRSANLGIKNHFYGRKHTELSRKKMKLSHINQEIIYENTSIEVKLQNKLKELNISFRTQEKILGRPDLFIAPNIVVFADGCYWHNCKECFLLSSTKQNNQNRSEKDRFITEELKSQGYVVLRFWEHDINKNFEQVIKEIMTVLGKTIIYIND